MTWWDGSGERVGMVMGLTSPSSAEQNPELTGLALSDLSPMEQRGEAGVLDTEDRGLTLTRSCPSLEWADLLDWSEVGREEAEEELPELSLSAVRARVIFLRGLGWDCLDLILLARVARNALASSFLVDG